MNRNSLSLLLVALLALAGLSLYSVVSDNQGLPPLSNQTAQVGGSLSQGLVGYWSLDGNANDSVGGNNGTLSGGPSWVSGSSAKIGGALSFDGVDDFVNIGSGAGLNLQGNTSWFGWVKFNDVNGGGYGNVIFGECISGGFETLTLKVGAVGGALTNVWNDINISNSSSILSTGSWYHVGFVRSGTSGNWKSDIYINGVLNNSTSGITTNPSGQTPAAIGRCGNSNGQYFNGTIDEVYVYNRALLSSEISDLYNYTGVVIPVSDTTAPSIPTNLSSSNITQTSATISWSASTDAVGVTGYKVFKNGSQVTTVTGTSYTDSSLTANTTYSYTVSAYDLAQNNSNQSSPVSVTTQVGTPATDTTAPVISVIGSSGITQSSATISWTTNESSDTQIEYGLTTAYGSNTSLNTSLVTSHSQNLSGLESNTVYHYKVKSRDVAGNLAQSGDTTFTTTSFVDAVAPSIPQNLSANAISSTQINLSWSPSTDDSGSVAGYYIYRCQGVACTPTNKIATVNALSYQNTGLSANTTYQYSVAAYDSSLKVSSKSSVVAVATQLATSLSQGLLGYWTFDEGSGSQAADSSGNGNTLSLSNSPSWVGAGKVNGALSFNGSNNFASESGIDLSLTNEASVSFWLNESSYSAQGTILELTSNYANSNSAFGIFQSDISTCGANSLSINVKGDAGFNVKCYAAPSAGWHHYVAIFDKGNRATNEVVLYIDGVLKSAASQPYNFDNINNLSNSPLNVMSRGGSTWFISGILDDLRIYSRILSSAEITQIFKYSGLTTLPPPVSSYSISVIKAGTGAGTVTSVPTGINCGTVCSLSVAPNTSVTLTAVPASGSTFTSWSGCTPSASNQAVCTVLVSANTSVTVSFNNPLVGADTTPPSTPTLFRASGITSSQLTLSWRASTDNIGVAGYNIYRNGSTAPINSSPITALTYTNSGLTANTTYSYTISAVDSAGNRSLNANVSATTQPTGSAKFSLNDRVKVVSGPLNVRSTPNGTSIGAQSTGAFGTIVNGVSSYVGGLNWWNITYDTPSTGCIVSTTQTCKTGWSAEGYLTSADVVPPETTPPTVTAFTIPATASTLVVPISSFTATDNIGVTGYIITESATAPLATATGWTSTAPTSYTFTTQGTKTLYAWAKDAAGNVSLSRSAGVTVTVPNTYTISITKSGTGTGTITSSVGSINCGTVCTSTPITSGTSVTLTATADQTSTFFAWNGISGCTTSRTCTITVNANTSTNAIFNSSPGIDLIAPTVTAFTILATASTLVVPVSSFTATDNFGVTGYMINESATAPLATATGWTSITSTLSATISTSYTFTTQGTKTLYAWVKDAAGYVSLSRSAVVTVSTTPNSTKFTTGQQVTPNVTVNVRSSAAGTLIGTQVVGIIGTIIGGPVQALLSGVNYWWWNINFDSGFDGWVSEDGLNAYTSGSTFYIRDGATGTSCTDWGTNACDVLPANLQRGATYYIADGVYPSYVFDDIESGTQYITIKKAVDTGDHGSATGWTSTMGDGEAVLSPSNIVRGYYILDGQKEYGFKINVPDGESNAGIRIGRAVSPNTISNITLRYFDIFGPYGDVPHNFMTESRAIEIFPYYQPTDSHILVQNVTIEHNNLHAVPTIIQIDQSSSASMNNLIVQYNKLHDNLASSGYDPYTMAHQNTLYAKDTKGIIYRYNEVYRTSAVGYYPSSNSSNHEIYGNVFHDIEGYAIWIGENGAAQTGVKIYNNTFINVDGSYIASGNGGTTGVASNNIFYNSSDPQWQNVVGSNNWCVLDTTKYQWCGAPASPFVSATDYHLKSALGGATTLSSPYNIDFVGKIRGSDGTWDIGAYEFTGTVITTNTLTVTKSGTGAGTVTGGTINCGTTCSQTVTTPSSVTLTATPSTGTFTGWSGACTNTSGTCTVSINGAVNVTANFTAPVVVSTKFTIGQKVTPNATVNVRSTPAGTLLGTQAVGVVGTVTAGPIQAALNGPNFWWWTIDFPSGADGWVGEDALDAYTAPQVVGSAFYVTPTGAGLTNGSSWANAFAGFGDVVWGGTTGVRAGTTLYVGAGTYTQPLVVGAQGTAASRLTIRAAQDTNIGVAYFNGSDINGNSVNYSGNDYVTIDGGYNGNRNFETSQKEISAQQTTSAGFHYFTVNPGFVDFRYSGYGDISYNSLSTVGSQEETTFMAIAETHPASYGQAKFHHNIVTVPGKIDNGNGPDGIQTGDGYDIYNNIFQAINDERYTGPQHQDLIQAYGDQYLNIYNNEFIDSGDSQLDLSASGNVSKGNLHVYNNIFRRTINNMGTVMLRIYTDSGGVISSYNDLKIENNTFIDGARTAGSYGAAMRFQALSSNFTATNSTVKNNIVYNSGDGWPAILVDQGPISAGGVVFSNNLINAGSEGNANISGVTNTNGQTGAPQFVSYTPYVMSNDLRLKSTDTSAMNKGATLTTFSTDRIGTSRPQGTTWDIGAYEYTGIGASASTPNIAGVSDIAGSVELSGFIQRNITWFLVGGAVILALIGIGLARRKRVMQ